MTEIRIPITPELKILARNHRFALRTKQNNPGASGVMLAYEHAQKNLFHRLQSFQEVKDSTELDSIQKIDWSAIQTDENWLSVPSFTPAYTTTQSALRLTELQRIDPPKAFASDLADDRKQQFDDKWDKLTERDEDGIRLRDWPDDLLTELLWEIAHQPRPPAHLGEYVKLRFDDSSECWFPVGVLNPPTEHPSADRASLFLSMISNRHPEMDAMTHGSLFLNRETQLDGELSVLAAETCERAKRLFLRVPENLTLHVFQTGLAAVVVGLWLGVIEAKRGEPATGETHAATGVPGWSIIPRFFRKLENTAPSSHSSFARGRPW